MPAFYCPSTRPARQIAVVIALLSANGIPAAQAQIDLGSMLRKALPTARTLPGAAARPGSNLITNVNSSECTNAATWLASDVSTLPPEFADNGRFGRTVGRAEPATQEFMGTPTESLFRSSGEKYGRHAEVKRSEIPRDNWLLEDSRFVPHFGKPYDQMTDQEIMENRKIGANCQMMGRTAQGVTVDIRVYERVFSTGIFPVYARGLQTIRATRQEIREATALLKSMPDSDDSYQIYVKILQNAPRLRGFMTVPDRLAFEPALEAADTRVAKPAMVRQAQQYLATAQGYEGMVAVHQLIADMGGAERNAPARNDAMVKALLVKRDELAKDLHRMEHGRIDALGTGLVGLERGVAYSNEIEPRYRKYIKIGPIEELWNEFISKRHAMIESSRPELTRRIAQTWDEDGLKKLVDKYIPFGLDQGTAAGTALLTRVTEQRDEIEKRRVLGANYAATPAHASAATAGGASLKTAAATKGGTAAKAVKTAVAEPDSDAEPLAKGEPSESEMYDLLKGQFDEKAANIKAANANCERGPSGNDVFGAINCLGIMAKKGMGAGEPVKITSFEKLGCGRASGKPGFVCDYMIGISGGITTAMGPTVAAMYGSGGAAQARFLKSKKGWTVFFGEKN